MYLGRLQRLLLKRRMPQGLFKHGVGPMCIVQRCTSSSRIKEIDDIPGPRSLPLIGTLYKYLPFGGYSFARAYESDMKRYKKYGRIVKEEIFPGTYHVHLFDPDDIATLFRQEGKYPKRKAIEGFKAYREARGISPGLGILTGEPWRHLRGSLQVKLMRRDSAALYVSAHEAVTDDFVNRMRILRDDKMEVPDYLNELYRWAMESIGVLCFNDRLGVMDMDCASGSEAERFISAVSGAFHGMYRTMFLWDYYKTRPNCKTMRNFYEDLDTIRDISERHTERFLEKVYNKEDMLVPPETSLLLHLLNKAQLSQDESLSTITDLFVGGTDTTAHTLAFNLYNLAVNPRAQKCLQAEIDNLLLEEKALSYQAIDNMKYLRAVTKETFRLSPTSNGYLRDLNEDIVLGGYRIPAETTVFLGTSVICRLPQYYKEPDKFIPERWFRDEAGDMTDGHRFSLLPFGHGPRMCIGRRFAEQEVYIGLIKILQNFNVEYHHAPIGQVTRLVNMPDKPLRLTFLDRK